MAISSLGEGRVYLLTFLGKVCHSEESGQELQLGRNLEAGIATELTAVYCLLACFSWFTQPWILSYIPQDCLAKDAADPSDLCFPISITG